MDFCFEETLDIITKLNGNKANNLEQLAYTTIWAAGTLISCCDLSVRQISSYINKLFKMADGYITEYNATIPESEAHKRLSKNMVSRTYDAFKRKKDAI